jgi:predicted lactoylglutathione lyase
MINYITIGSNDLAASAAFFDALFGALGGTQSYRISHQIGYSFGEDTPMVLVTRPFDTGAATAGNGVMIALKARDRAQVAEIHALAIKLGASDEGAPGPRGRSFYGGYFRDLDGNKFNVSVTV